MTIDSVLVHTLTEYLPSGINKPIARGKIR